MSENSNGNKFKSVVNVIVGLIVLAGIFVVAGTVITRSKQAVCDHVWNDELSQSKRRVPRTAGLPIPAKTAEKKFNL